MSGTDTPRLDAKAASGHAGLMMPSAGARGKHARIIAERFWFEHGDFFEGRMLGVNQDVVFGRCHNRGYEQKWRLAFLAKSSPKRANSGGAQAFRQRGNRERDSGSSCYG